MDPTGRFRIHRVLAGVLVGLALLTLGGYGWLQYESAQYRDRAASLVARYKSAYEFCVRTGAVASVCAAQAVDACSRDTFWTTGGPFDAWFDDDAVARCRSVS